MFILNNNDLNIEINYNNYLHTSTTSPFSVPQAIVGVGLIQVPGGWGRGGLRLEILVTQTLEHHDEFYKQLPKSTFESQFSNVLYTQYFQSIKCRQLITKRLQESSFQVNFFWLNLFKTSCVFTAVPHYARRESCIFVHSLMKIDSWEFISYFPWDLCKITLGTSHSVCGRMREKNIKTVYEKIRVTLNDLIYPCGISN